MLLSRALSAWILLATFVVGAIGVPVAHHVHHGVTDGPEQQAVVRAIAQGDCHSDAAHHAETPTLASDGPVHVGADCTLCATRHLSAHLSVGTALSPTQHAVERGLQADDRASDALRFHRPIRGPPLHG